MTTLRHLLESNEPDDTKLLQRRMIALRLDIEAWAEMEPSTFDDLQRSCASCVSRHQCALDMVLSRYAEMDSYPFGTFSTELKDLL